MQKVFNTLSTVSFIISGALVVAGVTVYYNRDRYADELREVVTSEITQSLPDIIKGVMGGDAMGTDLAPDIPPIPQM
jgi:hypothetical protein